MKYIFLFYIEVCYLGIKADYLKYSKRKESLYLVVF